MMALMVAAFVLLLMSMQFGILQQNSMAQF
jgi:hypothetical protein